MPCTDTTERDPASDAMETRRKLDERYFLMAVYDTVSRGRRDWASRLNEWFDMRWLTDPAISDACRGLMDTLAACDGQVPPLEMARVLNDVRHRHELPATWLTGIIVQRTCQGAHLLTYGRRIHDRYRATRAGDEAVACAERLSLSDDPDSVMDALGEIPRKYGPPELKERDACDEAIDEIAAELDGTAPRRIAYGVGPLDDFLGGMRPGNLIVVGAATGNGKSCLLAQTAMYSALKDLGRAFFFTVEMSHKEVFERYAHLLGGSARLTRSRETAGVLGRLHKVTKTDRRLVIHAGPCTLDRIVGVVQASSSVMPVSVVCVDYLQLVTPPRGCSNRQEEVTEIVRGLKRAATALKVPVMTASQVNRDGEDRLSLRSLRESGAIEQDADVVILMSQENRSEPVTRVRAIVAKNRHGPAGVVEMMWDKPIHRFRRLEPSDP